MKNETVELQNSANLLFGQTSSHKNYEADYKRNFQNFTLPAHMNDQEVAPPLHVWDKISRILDEQDRNKNLTRQSSHRSFQTQTLVNTKSANYNKIIIALIGAAGILGLSWLFSTHS